MIVDKKVFVKGIQKIAWINYIFRECGPVDCHNFEDLGLDMNLRSDELYDACDYHKHIFECKEGHCALTIAKKMN